MSKPGLARWFGRVPVLRAGAGECARRRSNFLLLRQKKVTKEKATPSLRPLRGAKGQTCGGAVAGCAVELALLLRSAARTATASQITKHARSDARATPQPPRRRRSHRGWAAEHPNSHTGRRCARPGTRSVARAACYLLSCAPGHRRPKKPWSSRPHCPATFCLNVCAVAGSESLGMDQNEVLVLLGGNVAKSRPSPPGLVTSSTWQSTRLCPTR